jgi:VanZ family protein
MAVVAALVTAAVVIGHLLPGLDATEIDHEIRNALHVIGFALVAAVIFESLRTTAVKAALITLVLVAILGALSEFTQKFGGKEIDLQDLYRDIAGAMIYLCARTMWIWTNTKRRSPVVHFFARLASIVLGILLIVPLGYWISVNARIAAQIPTILDFDGRWDSYLYEPIDAEVSLVESDLDVDETAGFLIDYGEIKRVVRPLMDRLDHRVLNEIEGLDNPTSEMLAVWIWDRLASDLPLLSEVVVHETCTSRCHYQGP